MQIVCYGEFIRRVRMFHGLSQKELAMRCRLKPQYLSAIECGKKQVSVSMIERIAAGLDLSPDQLLLQGQSLNIVLA